jgi:sulfite oxidase
VWTLESLRVGALSDWDGDETQGIDMFSDDPDRNATHVVLFDRPWQTETSPTVLPLNFLTPNTSLYVRNHAPVPQISSDDHSITFVSMVAAKEMTFALAELERRHPTRDITAVLQCTGNRASDNIVANGTSGFSGSNDENIQAGMVGNVRWTGVSLAKVLREDVGIVLTDDGVGPGSMHVEIHGADGYYSAVPLSIVMDPANDCLLATRQNGELLLPDHGFPMRVVLPGIVGARNVKWVTRIVVRRGEGDSPWNTFFYKNKSEPVQSDGSWPSCLHLRLNSMVLTAEADGKGRVRVKGIAYSGASGEEIDAVEVSGDRGRSWHPTEIQHADGEEPDDSSKHWHWVRWCGTLEADGRDSQEVWCRAFTKLGSTQPEVSPQCGGYLYNGWHKVPVA